jgi:hypothetical protein
LNPTGVRQHVKAAVAFLDWLTARDLTLAACRRNDLDAWNTGGQASYRRETGHFIRWAKQQKLASLDFPATRWGGPSRVIDTEARWEQARRLLHDASLDPEDRVAGLLVLLATDLPAAVLARLLGIHITVAAAWQRASAGDWASYAAEISRRKGTGNVTPT